MKTEEELIHFRKKFADILGYFYPKNNESFTRIFEEEVYARYGVTVSPATKEEVHGAILQYQPHTIQFGQKREQSFSSEKYSWKLIDLYILSHSLGFTPWGTNDFPEWTIGVEPVSFDWNKSTLYSEDKNE